MYNLFLGKITDVRCNLLFFSMHRTCNYLNPYLPYKAGKDLDNYRFFRFELNGKQNWIR